MIHHTAILYVYNDKEVYLLSANKWLFKDTFQKTDEDCATVRGQLIKEDEGQFFIMKILKDATK